MTLARKSSMVTQEIRIQSVRQKRKLNYCQLAIGTLFQKTYHAVNGRHLKSHTSKQVYFLFTPFIHFYFNNNYKTFLFLCPLFISQALIHVTWCLCSGLIVNISNSQPNSHRLITEKIVLVMLIDLAMFPQSKNGLTYLSLPVLDIKALDQFLVADCPLLISFILTSGK